MNHFDKSRRHDVKVELDNGDIIKTEINGTVDQVVGYYIGKPFNLGVENDTISIGKKIWFSDGEHYMQHHRIYKKIYESGTCYLIDHGGKLGVELHHKGLNGSKYFTDERREQVLSMKNNQIEKLLIKEF